MNKLFLSILFVILSLVLWNTYRTYQIYDLVELNYYVSHNSHLTFAMDKLNSDNITALVKSSNEDKAVSVRLELYFENPIELSSWERHSLNLSISTITLKCIKNFNYLELQSETQREKLKDNILKKINESKHISKYKINNLVFKSFIFLD